MKIKYMSSEQLKELADQYTIISEPFMAIKCLNRSRKLSDCVRYRKLMHHRIVKIADLNGIGNFDIMLTKGELELEVDLWTPSNGII